MNQVTLIGRLGRDPEIRATQSSKRVANLSIATSERYKKDGEWKEATEWHNVVVWGDVDAERLNEARKGDEVMVVGKLTTRKWQDKDGKDCWKTEVVVQFPTGQVRLARAFKSGGSGAGNSGGQGGGWGGGSGSGRGGQETRGGWDASKKPDLDDDIPF